MTHDGFPPNEPTKWAPMRFVYLQHPSDPMSFFSPDLAFTAPDWLGTDRGPDISPYFSWYPLVTFFQVGFDIPMATTVPSGHGHNFTPAGYVNGWLAVTAPENWSADDTLRLKQRFANLDHPIDSAPKPDQISAMVENPDDILTLLPARLKEARRKQGLSLDAVANLSGVSRSMVSQIERGNSSPTIATLWNLTRALQVDFAGLLDADNDGDKIQILRATDVPTIDNMGHGCRIRILSPPEEAGHHEVYELDFDAGGVLNSQPHTRGAREYLIGTSGTLTVTSGSAIEQVGPGDTARYNADITHSIAATNGPAQALLIVKNA